MKLQRLVIQNIASIEQATIDFTMPPLSDTGLFLITGNTGSGKSTLLDAICLALYATTPRLKNTKADGKLPDGSKEIEITDTRQLMRRNTKEAFVRLTFTGSDGNDYEAEWSAVRKTKNIDRRWRLTNLTHPEASPDMGTGAGSGKDRSIQAAIQTAVGLDFDQFCRTTMLAQGEFTRFLNSDDKEKAEILEKVTGTAIYSQIGAKVYEITAEHDRAWRSAASKTEGIQTLSDEQIDEKRQQLVSLESDLSACQQSLNQLQIKQQWLKQSALLAQQQNEHQVALTAAKATLTDNAYLKDKQTINQWDATAEVRGRLNEVATCNHIIEEQERSLQKAHNTYGILLSGWLSLDRDIQADKRAIADIESRMTPSDKSLTLPQLREQRNNLAMLIGNLRLAYTQLETLKKAQLQYDTTKQQLTVQEHKIAQLLVTIQQIEPRLHDVQIKFETCRQVLDKQKETINSFAKTLRERLHTGDLCPICGQRVEHDIPHESVWQQLVSQAQTAYDNALNEQDTLNRTLQQARAEHKALTQTYAVTLLRHQQDTSVQDAQNQLLTTCHECQLSDSLLASPLQEQELSHAIYQAGTEAKNTLQNTDALINTYDTIQQLTTRLERNVKEQQLLDQTRQLILGLMPDWTDERPASDIAPKAINRLSEQMVRLQADIASSFRLRQDAMNRLNEAQKAINLFLTNHSEIDQPLLLRLNQLSLERIRAIREDITRKQSTVEQQQILLTNIQKQIAEHQRIRPDFADDDTSEHIQQLIAETEQHIRTLSETKGAVNQALLNDQQTKQMLQTYIDEANQKKQLHDRWTRLNNLIGDKEGTKFRKIAQAYLLANLVQAANVYMQRLTNRYTLHAVPGQFIIMVEDAYQGYVSRPASTISGGESFLVSLALALALSDIGQSLRVETLFIDEGFGTLSGEPLQKAIETLQSLRQHAGRQVGIISHIDEVRERIPVQIQVQQEGNNSASTVNVTTVL